MKLHFLLEEARALSRLRCHKLGRFLHRPRLPENIRVAYCDWCGAEAEIDLDTNDATGDAVETTCTRYRMTSGPLLVNEFGAALWRE